MYSYPKLLYLHDAINKRLNTGSEWEKRWALTHALYQYIAYTEAQVNLQEESTTKYFSNHTSDTLYKFDSLTISTYSFIVACIELAEELSKEGHISLKLYQKWVNEMRDKRNRLSAHPSKKSDKRKKIDIDLIAYPPTMHSSTGELRFRVVHIEGKGVGGKHSRYIFLHPRKDFNILLEYLDHVADELKKEWKL